MPPFPSTRLCRTTDDIRTFFDAFASSNTEKHGPASTLLQYRVSVLKRFGRWSAHDTVVDLGCGNGHHLAVMADDIAHGIGVDLAPQMIASARRLAVSPNLSFRVDDVETCDVLRDASADVVMCTGVIEHVLRPGDVFRQIRRILRPGGRFVILTVNGSFWWYRFADRLGLPTRHLSSDRRLTADDARRLFAESGLDGSVAPWTFVPRGDIPAVAALACDATDAVGKWLNASSMRGGLVLYGSRPAPSPDERGVRSVGERDGTRRRRRASAQRAAVVSHDGND
jgi:SAM-dependent methyltransferase